MWKYFTHDHTYNFIDVLDSLMENCNHTYHSSKERAPSEVTAENESTVWFTLYGEMQHAERKYCIFITGDIGRVLKQKLTFVKGYETNWTEEPRVKKPSCVYN